MTGIGRENAVIAQQVEAGRWDARAASFSINSKGDNSRWVVPSDQGVLRRKVR